MSDTFIADSRTKILSLPNDQVIKPVSEVQRLTVDTSIKSYVNPNTLDLKLASLGVDSEGNTPLQSLTSFLNGRTPISYIDADEWSGSGTYTDSVLGLSWSVVNGSKATVDGIESIDLETNNNRYMETATRTAVGQNYVHFYAWRPRVSNSGWRTLFRGDNDHWVIVQNNATDLGMYSNRNGAFRDTGYDLTAGEWQTLIVVGVGDSATATTGTQTYYVNGVNVGTTDRVVSGTNTYRLGWTDSQSPGYIKVAGVINSTLTSAEIIELNDILNAKIGGNSNVIGYTDLSSQDLVDTTYFYESGFTLPKPIMNIQRVNSFKTYLNTAIQGLKTRIQSISRISDYELDDGLGITLTNTRTIQSNVSASGGGETSNNEVVTTSTLKQIWY